MLMCVGEMENFGRKSCTNEMGILSKTWEFLCLSFLFFFLFFDLDSHCVSTSSFHWMDTDRFYCSVNDGQHDKQQMALSCKNVRWPPHCSIANPPGKFELLKQTEMIRFGWRTVLMYFGALVALVGVIPGDRTQAGLCWSSLPAGAARQTMAVRRRVSIGAPLIYDRSSCRTLTGKC